LAKVERFVQRYGAPVIIIARFVVVARQLNGIAAGSLGMHWLRFLTYNCIGAALWVGFWSTLAFWLGKNIYSLVDHLHSFEPLAIGVAIAVALLVAAYLWWRMRRQTGKT
jgi:membrane protein DedA with SNARE-associated domain